MALVLGGILVAPQLQAEADYLAQQVHRVAVQLDSTA